MLKDKKICILDYGSGNVRSVFNIFSSIAGQTVISNKAEDIVSATHIVLPGVGAFGSAMQKIKDAIPLGVLEKEVLENKKPFLGICVGMQVLADKGFEFGEYDGLGWIPGAVKKLDAGDFPLPHIGWNDIEVKKEIPLLKGLGGNKDFYFVHSYVFEGCGEGYVVAQTDYGSKFNSVISRGDNIFGVQFHPEKSQKTGRLLIENFINL